MRRYPRYNLTRHSYLFRERNPNWGIITTAIAAVPIIGSIGFVIAFLHEIGYASVFGMPIELIKLDSTIILEYVFITLLLFFLFGLTASVLALINNIKANGFWTFLCYANFIITPLFLYISIRGYISIYVSLALLILQMILLVPLDKLTREQDQNITIKIKKFLKNWQLLVISGLFIVFILAYISGFTDGRLQRTYLVPSINPESIVLKIYGDEAICAPVTDNRIIKRSFFIIELNEPNLVLSPHEFSNFLIVEPK